ncbi:MAG TPA: DUF3618 domain-containing protein [Alphaproteobacteria bacterium]|nr:DUF3618 domain-containing protein [Alphaproteobacteria bacterium]
MANTTNDTGGAIDPSLDRRDHRQDYSGPMAYGTATASGDMTDAGIAGGDTLGHAAAADRPISYDNRSPDEIEAEIARRRAAMSETLEAISRKLSPGQIMDEALGYVRTNGGTEFAQNLATSAKNNPIPVALVGIGIAWLMLGGGGQPRYLRQRRSEEPRYLSTGGYRSEGYAYDSDGGTQQRPVYGSRKGRPDHAEAGAGQGLGQSAGQPAFVQSAGQPALGQADGDLYGDRYAAGSTEDYAAGYDESGTVSGTAYGTGRGDVYAGGAYTADDGYYDESDDHEAHDRKSGRGGMGASIGRKARGAVRSVGGAVGGAVSHAGHAAGSAVAGTVRSAAGSVGGAASSVVHAVADTASSAAQAVAGTASRAVHAVADAAADVAGSAVHVVSNLGNRMGSAMSNMTHRNGRAEGRVEYGVDHGEQHRPGMATRARHGAGRMTTTVGRTAREQPFLVGLAGFAAGMVVAMMLPATRRESELLGETRDEVLNRAKEAGREGFERVREVAAGVATTAVEAAREEADRQGLHLSAGKDVVHEVADKVRAVAGAAVSAAREEATAAGGASTGGSQTGASAGGSVSSGFNGA